MPAPRIGLLSLLVLVACSDATTINVRNETLCTFENVQGFKLHPKTGEAELVFAFERVDPRDERPAHLDLDWTGTLLVTADQPADFRAEFTVEPRLRNMTLPLSVDGPLDCRLRSAEDY